MEPGTAFGGVVPARILPELQFNASRYVVSGRHRGWDAVIGVVGRTDVSDREVLNAGLRSCDQVLQVERGQEGDPLRLLVRISEAAQHRRHGQERRRFPNNGETESSKGRLLFRSIH